MPLSVNEITFPSHPPLGLVTILVSGQLVFFCVSLYMLNIMVEWVAVCFIFGRSQVQISAQRLVFLDKGVHGFSQSVKINASIVPQTGPKLL